MQPNKKRVVSAKKQHDDESDIYSVRQQACQLSDENFLELLNKLHADRNQLFRGFVEHQIEVIENEKEEKRLRQIGEPLAKYRLKLKNGAKLTVEEVLAWDLHEGLNGNKSGEAEFLLHYKGVEADWRFAFMVKRFRKY